MVGSARHGDDQKGLYQNADGESVHRKACGVDLGPQEVDNALPIAGGRRTGSKRVQRHIVGGRGGLGGRRAGLGRVREEDALISGQLLEGDGNEAADAADDEDLGRPTVAVPPGQLFRAGGAGVFARVFGGIGAGSRRGERELHVGGGGAQRVLVVGQSRGGGGAEGGFGMRVDPLMVRGPEWLIVRHRAVRMNIGPW